MDKLKTGRPVVIAGDLNTFELYIHHWMQQKGREYNVHLASSDAEQVQHGYHTFAANVNMWTVANRVGRRFHGAGILALDSLSDARDMVCVALAPMGSVGRS